MFIYVVHVDVCILTVPFLALASTFLPASRMGIASSWMGDGLSKPFSNIPIVRIRYIHICKYMNVNRTNSNVYKGMNVCMYAHTHEELLLQVVVLEIVTLCCGHISSLHASIL